LKHGLSLPVLDQFGQLLERFDGAVALGTGGRIAHKTATRELQVLARELTSVVRVMDARNRLRFADDPALLQAWISARTIQGGRSGSTGARDEPDSGTHDNTAGTTQSTTPVAGGEVRPAE
jgi:hypothetical protein